MKRLLPWIISLLILVVGFGTIYGAVQQAQRRDANWPQVQIAEDAAATLDKSVPAKASAEDVSFALPVTDKVDMAHSLAPFRIVYDKSGKVVSSSGYLNGKVPTAPLGVLKDAEGQDYNAVTWEPGNTKDVRIAAVTVAAKDYYVLSGRNLKEVEKNENNTLKIALLGGFIAAVLLVVLFIFSIATDEY